MLVMNGTQLNRIPLHSCSDFNGDSRQLKHGAITQDRRTGNGEEQSRGFSRSSLDAVSSQFTPPSGRGTMKTETRTERNQQDVGMQIGCSRVADQGDLSGRAKAIARERRKSKSKSGGESLMTRPPERDYARRYAVFGGSSHVGDDISETVAGRHQSRMFQRLVKR